MALNRPLDSVEESDLQELIDNQVPEGKTIEYKEALPGNSDGDKKEFLADVSSFANAAGGDLIFGYFPINCNGCDSDSRKLNPLRHAGKIRENICYLFKAVFYIVACLTNYKARLVVYSFIYL